MYPESKPLELHNDRYLSDDNTLCSCAFHVALQFALESKKEEVDQQIDNLQAVSALKMITGVTTVHISFQNLWSGKNIENYSAKSSKKS